MRHRKIVYFLIICLLLNSNPAFSASLLSPLSNSETGIYRLLRDFRKSVQFTPDNIKGLLKPIFDQFSSLLINKDVVLYFLENVSETQMSELCEYLNSRPDALAALLIEVRRVQEIMSREIAVIKQKGITAQVDNIIFYFHKEDPEPFRTATKRMSRDKVQLGIMVNMASLVDKPDHRALLYIRGAVLHEIGHNWLKNVLDYKRDPEYIAHAFIRGIQNREIQNVQFDFTEIDNLSDIHVHAIEEAFANWMILTFGGADVLEYVLNTNVKIIEPFVNDSDLSYQNLFRITNFFALLELSQKTSSPAYQKLKQWLKPEHIQFAGKLQSFVKGLKIQADSGSANSMVNATAVEQTLEDEDLKTFAHDQYPGGYYVDDGVLKVLKGSHKMYTSFLNNIKTSDGAVFLGRLTAAVRSGYIIIMNNRRGGIIRSENGYLWELSRDYADKWINFNIRILDLAFFGIKDNFTEYSSQSDPATDYINEQAIWSEPDIQAAMDEFGLTHPFSEATLKRKYRVKAFKLHQDKQPDPRKFDKAQIRVFSDVHAVYKLLYNAL